MKILVDADACPVRNIIEDLAQQYNLEVIMVSNHHHELKSSYARVLTVDSYSQSVDIAIANLASTGDIVYPGLWTGIPGAGKRHWRHSSWGHYLYPGKY